MLTLNKLIQYRYAASMYLRRQHVSGYYHIKYTILNENQNFLIFKNIDKEPEKWDLVPTEEHIDRLAPVIGNNSLAFLIELGMEFQTWEQMNHRQNERDLVRLNKEILEEWKTTFCRLHTLKPTLRKIAQAFSNIGKNIKIVENSILDLL